MRQWRGTRQRGWTWCAGAPLLICCCSDPLPCHLREFYGAAGASAALPAASQLLTGLQAGQKRGLHRWAPTPQQHHETAHSICSVPARQRHGTLCGHGGGSQACIWYPPARSSLACSSVDRLDGRLTGPASATHTCLVRPAFVCCTPVVQWAAIHVRQQQQQPCGQQLRPLNRVAASQQQQWPQHQQQAKPLPARLGQAQCHNTTTGTTKGGCGVVAALQKPLAASRLVCKVSPDDVKSMRACVAAWGCACCR